MVVLRALLLLVLLQGAVRAEEGKWTPPQVLEFNPGTLQAMGLRIPPEEIWSPSKGTGLLSAAVNIGGCSASFVSATGLIATNHHCIFGILQEHSSTDNNIIRDGFLARTRQQELPSRTTRVTVPLAFTDVTEDIERAATGASDDLARYRAISRRQKELVAACESKPHRRCRLSQFDGGVQYILQEMMELPDVRLVYAPPRAIGEYGGGGGKWVWAPPTGDFGIARAYVSPSGEPAEYSPNNVPYLPQRFLQISQKPLRDGDFVMVLGYPGVTYRSLLAKEMEERRDLFFQRRVDLYGEWIELLNAMSREDEKGGIAVAADLKTLLNRHKNAQGQLDGFRRGSLVEKHREMEDRVATWAADRPEWSRAVAARSELLHHFEERLVTWERDFLFDNIAAGSKALYWATVLVQMVQEREKPDMERPEAFMERNLPRFTTLLHRQQKSYFEAADQQLFASWIRRARNLPVSQRIRAVDKFFPASMTEEQVRDAIQQLYHNSRVTDLDSRNQMIRESVDSLRKRQDPLLQFAWELEAQLADFREASHRWEGTVSRLRPQWRKAVMAYAGKPVAPDANGTLRVSFAHVKGYSPRDGVYYQPFTTLRGVLEKHTGKDPFDAPETLRNAARNVEHSRWKDQELGELAVNFLATGDTTGGNSGSPVVNGYGELVGLNFDRVWENVANDFGYNPAIARNVSVDIRYLLWTLEEIDKATELLGELQVAPATTQP